MPVINVNDAKLNYMQLSYKGEGEAENLVMIHGLAATMAFWLQDYAANLAQRFHVTLYDLRGHGRSAMTDDGYCPDNLALDLREFLDVLEIDKAHFMAHSFGGVVALNLACAAPERFSSLVLADTQICIGREKSAKTPWAAGEKIQQALKECNIDIDIYDPYFGYHLITAVARLRRDGQKIPTAISPWVTWILGGNNQRTAQRWLQLMEETKAKAQLMGDDHLSESRLRKVSCPVLAMYGENSQAITTGRYLENLWPQAKFTAISDSGHFFPKKNPELVRETCSEFWDENR